MILGLAEFALMAIGLWTAFKYVTRVPNRPAQANTPAVAPSSDPIFIVIPEYCNQAGPNKTQQLQAARPINPCATTVGCAPAFKDCGSGFHGGI
jgi:hypothetical protein